MRRDIDDFPASQPHQGRTLSDQDVQAIVFELRKQLTDEFYNDLGRGLWDWIKKIAIGAVLALAAYGAARGMKF